MPDVQILAVCDVDSWRLANAKQQVEEAYAKNSPSGSYKGCDTYKDFREILARKDIDAVMISTPDHWHVPMALAALEAGKDVSLEKPITRSIGEGRKLTDARQAAGPRVPRRQRAAVLPAHRAGGRAGPQRADRQGAHGDGGRAGQRRRLPAAARDARAAGTRLRGVARPGPARPVHRVPRHQAQGLRAAGLDAAPLLLRRHDHQLDDALERRGHVRHRPGADRARSRSKARGEYPPADSFWNVLLKFEVKMRFANGVAVDLSHRKAVLQDRGDRRLGLRRVHAASGQDRRPRRLSLLQRKEGQDQPALMPAPTIRPDEIHFYVKTDKQDFIDAVKTRGETLEPAEVGHRVTSLGHLGQIAIQVGGKLKWDPDKERFLGNDKANAMIDQPIHSPKA